VIARRKFIAALGASALMSPLSLRAQTQPKIWRIGFLWEREQADYASWLDAFNAGMRALGHVVGRDYAIEQRSAQADLGRLPAMIAELLALKIDMLVPSGTPAAIAAHRATRELPIVIATVGDPVANGLAASLRHPGGNVTGLTNLSTELFTKRLDLLHQILPRMQRVGFLYHPDNVNNATSLRQLEADCAKLRIKLIRAPMRSIEEAVPVFTALQRDKAQGLIVTNASTNRVGGGSILELAAKHRLPAIYASYVFVEAGGLISYAPNFPDLYRRAAAYAVKIIKGTKPGELPIEQPLKFETVVNLKTAKALGIKIPDVVMLRAERVIE
jgi:putative ABC transport system substrate-binding protein